MNLVVAQVLDDGEAQSRYNPRLRRNKPFGRVGPAVPRIDRQSEETRPMFTRTLLFTLGLALALAVTSVRAFQAEWQRPANWVVLSIAACTCSCGAG